MKKLGFLAAAFIMVWATSCKKDYTCSCDVNHDDTGVKLTTGTLVIEKASEDDANSECDDYGAELESNYTDAVTSTCSTEER